MLKDFIKMVRPVLAALSVNGLSRQQGQDRCVTSRYQTVPFAIVQYGGTLYMSYETASQRVYSGVSTLFLITTLRKLGFL